MWLTGAEPVQFKGGLIHTISKKQKSNKITDMRGIALLDGVAKLSHAMLRQQYIPHLSRWSAPLQLGGFETSVDSFRDTIPASLRTSCIQQTLIIMCFVFGYQERISLNDS